MSKWQLIQFVPKVFKHPICFFIYIILHICVKLYYYDRRQYPYLHHDTDFTHITQPYCAVKSSAAHIHLPLRICSTECLCRYWCFCLILISLVHFWSCEFRRMGNHSAGFGFWQTILQYAFQNESYETYQLWHCHKQTDFPVRTLTVTVTTIFWLYINVNACLKQSWFPITPPSPFTGACDGHFFFFFVMEDVLMNLFLFCLLWTVPSALDVYKCSFLKQNKTARTLDFGPVLRFFFIVLENMCNSCHYQEGCNSNSSSSSNLVPWSHFTLPSLFLILLNSSSPKGTIALWSPTCFVLFFSLFLPHILMSGVWFLYFSTCKLFTGAVCRY